MGVYDVNLEPGGLHNLALCVHGKAEKPRSIPWLRITSDYVTVEQNVTTRGLTLLRFTFSWPEHCAFESHPLHQLPEVNMGRANLVLLLKRYNPLGY